MLSLHLSHNAYKGRVCSFVDLKSAIAVLGVRKTTVRLSGYIVAIHLFTRLYMYPRVRLNNSQRSFACTERTRAYRMDG